MYIVQRGTFQVGCIFYTITSYFTSENFSLRYSDVYDAYAFSQKLKIIIYLFFYSQSCTLLDFLPFNYVLRCISRESSYVEQKKCCWLEKKDVILILIPTEYGRRPREEAVFTVWPEIQSQSQIYRYGQSIFCLPNRPNFSDIFDLSLHWVSVVRAHTLHSFNGFLSTFHNSFHIQLKKGNFKSMVISLPKSQLHTKIEPCLSEISYLQQFEL